MKRTTPGGNGLPTISLAEARRIALRAQGFGVPRPSKADIRHLRAALLRMALLQIDFVNVLIPAHYFVPFSRVGPYDRRVLDRLIYGQREFLEQWAHVASIVPMDCWPLLRHRREKHPVRTYGFEALLAEASAYPQLVLEEIRNRGPLAAEDLPNPDGAPRRLEDSWVGSVPRAALETHFGRGLIAVHRRRINYTREYDLVDRIVPQQLRDLQLDLAGQQRELLRRAAQAHGIGTVADIADYFRISPREARPRIQELCESGDLLPVQVEGWNETAYLYAKAPRPKNLKAAALLSPFDPVVWFRPRALRLFDFSYRIEIYLPEKQRTWGYYVLPFLLNERIAGRVDLKADRGSGQLVAAATYVEPGNNPAEVAPALAAELRAIARWLRLDSVRVERRGNLARPLAAAIKSDQ